MAKESLKVVVRLLPPEITEEEFLQTIPDTHLQNSKWMNFQNGKRYKGEAKPSFNSRCYFQFETLERAEDFIKDYHGHQFVDGQGETFRAVVCFAPYQKVPRLKPQKDPRDGTIEADPTYKEFVESLSGTKVTYEAPPNPITLLKPADFGDTPLLNYLKSRSKDRRGRLEKKDRKRWRDGGPGGLEQIAEEDPKKAKWHCAECGTSKHLEEDPDDRGIFYCTYCWESWENQQPPTSKAKKKKKKKMDEIEEEEKEEVDSRRRKKHEKERESTTESSHKTEWRAKELKETKLSSTNHHGDEDDNERRLKKKKKKGDDEAFDDSVDAGGQGLKNRWRVKKPDAAEEESGEMEWEKDRQRSRTKISHKDKDDWWREPAEEKVGKHSRRSEKPDKGDKADDGRGTRWRAKAPSAAEDDVGERDDRPRRSRKDKIHSEDSSEYWVPKVSHKS